MWLERFRLPLWRSALSVCERRRSENQAAADTVHSTRGVWRQQDPNHEFHATVYSFRALLLSLVNQACIFLKSHFEWSCLPVGFGLEMLFCFTMININYRKTSGSSNGVVWGSVSVFYSHTLRIKAHYAQHIPGKSSISLCCVCKAVVCQKPTEVLWKVRSLMYVLVSPQMHTSEALRGWWGGGSSGDPPGHVLSII